MLTKEKIAFILTNYEGNRLLDTYLMKELDRIRHLERLGNLPEAIKELEEEEFTDDEKWKGLLYHGE